MSFLTALFTARSKRVRCQDPDHHHRSPVQTMYEVVYNGHNIEITEDGGLFDVRIDRDPTLARFDLPRDEMVWYVEDNI